MVFFWEKTGGANRHTLTDYTFKAELPATNYQPSPSQIADTQIEAQDPLFLERVWPKINEFFSKLNNLNMNPLSGQLRPSACDRIKIIHIPNGMIYRLVIDDGWTATYLDSSAFSGMMYFGQRGVDDPLRAISHADTNTLSRLAQSAIVMSEVNFSQNANQVAEEFKIDFSKFEKPQMFEEGLFQYHLGIYTVRYRKKDSDPINQMNYTRSFSLKTISPNHTVLVNYSHLEASPQ